MLNGVSRCGSLFTWLLMLRDGGRPDRMIRGAHERVRGAVASWEGVSAGPHRFGGTEFRLGGRELGHMHGDYLVDIPFPRRIRDELVESGRCEPHHVLPHSGWVSYYIREEANVAGAIELLRMAYDLAVAKLESRAAAR